MNIQIFINPATGGAVQGETKQTQDTNPQVIATNAGNAPSESLTDEDTTSEAAASHDAGIAQIAELTNALNPDAASIVKNGDVYENAGSAPDWA